MFFPYFYYIGTGPDYRIRGKLSVTLLVYLYYTGTGPDCWNPDDFDDGYRKEKIIAPPGIFSIYKKMPAISSRHLWFICSCDLHEFGYWGGCEVTVTFNLQTEWPFDVFEFFESPVAYLFFEPVHQTVE